MAKRAPNPNTSYGRKRMRQEYSQRVENMSPNEKAKHNDDVSNANIWLWIMVISICVIAYLIGGTDGLLKTTKFLNNG